ncbi:MAG: hypothetical protein ACHBN1_24255 [Heteroscytonema crispum UTEX LB 1556]
MTNQASPQNQKAHKAKAKQLISKVEISAISTEEISVSPIIRQSIDSGIVSNPPIINGPKKRKK